MYKVLKSLKFNFLLAFLIRVLFTLYGLYHDSKAINTTDIQIPKYTDIDYQVFTDASYHVYHVPLILKIKYFKN